MIDNRTTNIKLFSIYRCGLLTVSGYDDLSLAATRCGQSHIIANFCSTSLVIVSDLTESSGFSIGDIN